MKILRNMVIVALIGVTGWTFAMTIDTQSQAWLAKPLKEKLEIVSREKEEALNRFRAKVGQDTLAEVKKEADAATKLDELENVLLIEQSQARIKDLEESLGRVRRRMKRSGSSWFSFSSSSSSSSQDTSQGYGKSGGVGSNLSPSSSRPPTKEEFEQGERKLELELDKERENLKRLKNRNNNDYQ